MLRPRGESPLLFICEHASNFIPEEYHQLGLDQSTANSHIAFDPGALELAVNLSNQLDATLVHGTVSRLLYDCNRPPTAIDAIPERSEIFTVPGNKELSEAQRRERVERIYRPFEQLVTNTVAQRSAETAIVTIHSFTPVYNGHARSVEFGVLHDVDSRLADAVIDLAASGLDLNVQRNQPYGMEDGVTHTLKVHGVEHNLLNVMLEVRNDLLSTQSQREAMAEQLGTLLTDAYANATSKSVSKATTGDAS